MMTSYINPDLAPFPCCPKTLLRRQIYQQGFSKWPIMLAFILEVACNVRYKKNLHKNQATNFKTLDFWMMVDYGFWNASQHTDQKICLLGENQLGVKEVSLTQLIKACNKLSSIYYYLEFQYAFFKNGIFEVWLSHYQVNSCINRNNPSQNSISIAGSFPILALLYRMLMLQIKSASFNIDPQQFKLEVEANINIIKTMIIIFGITSTLICFVLYQFYYRPKSEITKQITTFKKLGYTVYEIPFAFLGLSFMNQWQKGVSLHKDAFYYQRQIFPHVDIAIGNVLDKVVIFLVNPTLIKEFFSAQNIYKYPKYERMIEGLKQPVGVGITFSQGQMWKNKRKLMSKVFNFDFIKDSTYKIAHICDRCYEEFDKAHQIGQNTFKYDPIQISSKMFNGVMMKCFFGSDLVQEKINGQKFQQFIVQFSSLAAQSGLSPVMAMFGKWAWKLGLTYNIRLLKRYTHLLRQKSRQILKKRIEQTNNFPAKQKHSDIIQALIHEKLANKQQYSFSDEDIIAEFLSFLLAGTDTTANFYNVMTYLMGKYPEVQQKLRMQVQSIIKSENDITYENLKKITYLQWIQNETTRFRGSVPLLFFRLATQDNFIGDIPIKKGTIVNYQAIGSHFNPKFYQNPKQFRPERWEKQCENIDPYAFIGFSAGGRGCIGKHLAYLESKIAIVKMIMRYKTIKVPEEVTLKIGLVYGTQHFDVIYSK